MLTKEVIDYIRSERALGATRENITTALRQAGWSEKDIIDAFTAATPPMPTPRAAAPAQAHVNNGSFGGPRISDIAVHRTSGRQLSPVTTGLRNPYHSAVDENEKREHRQSLKGLGVILFTVAMSVGIWFYITRPDIPAAISTVEQRINNQINKGNNEQTADPLLVRLTKIRVPDAQNAARQPVFLTGVPSFKKMTAAEKDFLKKYAAAISTKNTPPLTQARAIVKKYDADITQIDQALALPYFQCLPILGDECASITGTVRTYAELSIIKAYVLSKDKSPDAQADALALTLSLGTLGLKATGNGDLIMNQAGLDTQKMAYSLAALIKGSAGTSTSTAIILTQAEKKAAINTLNQNLALYYRTQYTRDMSAIDFISNPQATTTVPLDQETRDELASLATYSTPVNWRPDETRLYYARSYQKAIDALSLPCTGPEPKNSAYDTGFSDNAAVESDNYIGKLMFTNSYHAFETSFFSKRCELERLINNL